MIALRATRKPSNLETLNVSTIAGTSSNRFNALATEDPGDNHTIRKVEKEFEIPSTSVGTNIKRVSKKQRVKKGLRAVAIPNARDNPKREEKTPSGEM